jgi:diaminopimelate epimerase
MKFVKYQGTGNDFIVLDGRELPFENLQVRELCDRRFGIGADGLMILKNNPAYDFEMVYFNSDGRLSSMCGNGGRCLAHFAASLGLGRNGHMNFIAVDGPHEAFVSGDQVELGMRDVNSWEIRNPDVYVLNTGSPHYVEFTREDLDDTDFVEYARSIRYSMEFAKEGINVNLVRENSEDHITMRTYERGVEDETLSCGTGVTAAALAYQLKYNRNSGSILVHTRGGQLKVLSVKSEHSFSSIVLAGPAVRVFEGEI